MILRKLRIQGFGPFHTEETIYIEPDVTILTGRNDTGKSTVLKAIELLLTNKLFKTIGITTDFVTHQKHGTEMRVFY